MVADKNSLDLGFDFNPKVYYVCKLCRGTFKNVDKLMDHKKLRHRDELKEFKNVKCILFEERFIEFPEDTSSASSSSSSASASSASNANHGLESETVQSVLARDEKKRTRSGCKQSKEIESDIEIISMKSYDSTADEEERVVTYIRGTGFKEFNIKSEDFDPKSKIKLEEEKDSTVSSDEVDLTDDQISKLISDDEVVQLPNPYIRLQKLTTKQIEAAINKSVSSVFKETDLSTSGSAITSVHIKKGRNRSSSLASTLCENNKRTQPYSSDPMEAEAQTQTETRNKSKDKSNKSLRIININAITEPETNDQSSSLQLQNTTKMSKIVIDTNTSAQNAYKSITSTAEVTTATLPEVTNNLSNNEEPENLAEEYPQNSKKITANAETQTTNDGLLILSIDPQTDQNDQITFTSAGIISSTGSNDQERERSISDIIDCAIGLNPLNPSNPLNTNHGENNSDEISILYESNKSKSSNDAYANPNSRIPSIAKSAFLAQCQRELMKAKIFDTPAMKLALEIVERQKSEALLKELNQQKQSDKDKPFRCHFHNCNNKYTYQKALLNHYKRDHNNVYTFEGNLTAATTVPKPVEVNKTLISPNIPDLNSTAKSKSMPALIQIPEPASKRVCLSRPDLEKGQESESVLSLNDSSEVTKVASSHSPERNRPSFTEWLQKQKQKPNQLILLDPDPLKSDVFPISVANSITCKLCNKKLISAAIVKWHANNCWRFNKKGHRYCIKCDCSFENARKLQEHNKNEHVSDTTNKSDNGKDAEKEVQEPELITIRVECKVCKKVFSRMDSLKLHMKLHEQLPLPSNLMNYICDICGNGFYTNPGLERHRLKHDDNGNGKKVGRHRKQKKVQNRVFTLVPTKNTKSNTAVKLDVHAMTNSNSKPNTRIQVKGYSCKVCERSFKSSEILEGHLKTHAGKDKSIDCKIANCDFRFYPANQNQKDTKTQKSMPETSSSTPTPVSSVAKSGSECGTGSCRKRGRPRSKAVVPTVPSLNLTSDLVRNLSLLTHNKNL